MKVWGFDLGVASIGYAVLNVENHNDILVDWGSRIFTPGVEGTEDEIAKGKGESRCAVRRTNRALRHTYQRRRWRKEKLTKCLQNYGLLPERLTPDFFTTVDKEILLSYPQDMRKQVGHVIPYILRKQALDTQLKPYQLGRAIYHLAQRRGFKSNRKSDIQDSETGTVKSAIAELANLLEESNSRTIGEYFASCQPEEERIRSRYTSRAMYEDEFNRICIAQRNLITAELQEELYDAIFFQRKLKSCKHLIGHCKLEPDEIRCSYMRQEAQQFRLLQSLNHLRVAKGNQSRVLTLEERSYALKTLTGFSGKLKPNGTITLAALGKEIKLAKGEKFSLGNEEKEIYGNGLNAIIYHVFGERATTLTATECSRFINDLNSIEKEEVLLNRLANFWKLDEVSCAKAVKVRLPDEYCSLSLKAINNLLPDLEANITLNTIIKLKYPEQFKHDVEFEYLPRLDDSKNISMDLRNPIVQRTLAELRRVVNALISKYGKPDKIRVELARDLKNSSKEREKIHKKNDQREKERKKIAQKITQECGISDPKRNDILKVMLANECHFECPYTGRHFSMKELLEGGLIHIEHIIPYSRCFDDSFRNKTLCYGPANAAKGNKTPFEAFSGEEYEKILNRVRHFDSECATAKLELFQVEKVDTDEFLSRNLNDTRYASKLAMEYLGMLFGGVVDRNGKRRIEAISGGCTAIVRRAWGGNYLLGEGEKVRDDHRHHAIDALTIALTSPELVKAVAMQSSEERKQNREKNTPLKYNEIYQMAKDKLDKIIVSHHTVNKLRGELHKDTIYSKDYGNTERHVRIALADLEAKEVNKIVDPAIKQLVKDKLLELGEQNPQKAFKQSTENPFANYPVMVDRQGNIVNIIKAVRVYRKQATVSIGTGDRKREVMSRNNYCMAIYAKKDAQGREISWIGEIISLIEALKRKQKGLPIVAKEKDGCQLKFTLKKGDTVTYENDGEEILCVIRGVTKGEISFVSVRDAREKKNIESKCFYRESPTSAFKGNLRKFSVSPIGILRKAND